MPRTTEGAAATMNAEEGEKENMHTMFRTTSSPSPKTASTSSPKPTLTSTASAATKCPAFVPEADVTTSGSGSHSAGAAGPAAGGGGDGGEAGAQARRGDFSLFEPNVLGGLGAGWMLVNGGALNGSLNASLNGNIANYQYLRCAHVNRALLSCE